MQAIKKSLQPLAKALLYALLSLWGYLILGGIIALLTGCSAKPDIRYIYEPKPYAVPTKCDLTLPKKPTRSGNIVQDGKQLAIDDDTVRNIAKECGARDE